jgi:hypothetical protein
MFIIIVIITCGRLFLHLVLEETRPWGGAHNFRMGLPLVGEAIFRNCGSRNWCCDSPLGMGVFDSVLYGPPVGDVVLDFRARRVFPLGMFLESESFSTWRIVSLRVRSFSSFSRWVPQQLSFIWYW